VHFPPLLRWASPLSLFAGLLTTDTPASRTGRLGAGAPSRDANGSSYGIRDGAAGRVRDEDGTAGRVPDEDGTHRRGPGRARVRPRDLPDLPCWGDPHPDPTNGDGHGVEPARLWQTGHGQRRQVSRGETCKGLSGDWGWSEERCRDRDGMGVWLSEVGRDGVEGELGEGVGAGRCWRQTCIGSWPLTFGSSRRLSTLRWRRRSSKGCWGVGLDLNLDAILDRDYGQGLPGAVSLATRVETDVEVFPSGAGGAS